MLIIGGEQSNEEEEYIMLPTKPVNTFIEQEIVAYPYNKLYSITSAKLMRGFLPEGLELNEVSGEIRVNDPALLNEGIYEGIEIKTYNRSQSSNYHVVTIILESKTVFDVAIAAPKPLDRYLNGDQLIQVRVPNGSLQGVKAISGQLAPGTALNSGAGVVYVNDTKTLAEGTYAIELYMKDSGGAEDTQRLQYTIGADNAEFPKVVLTLSDTGDFHTRANGDSLSEFTPEKLITKAALVGGELPKGTTVSERTGTIIISDRTELSSELAVSKIELVSANKMKKEFDVSIKLSSVPEFSIVQENFLFLSDFPNRLKKFQAKYFSDSEITAAIDPYFIPIVNFAIRLKKELANPDINQIYLDGGKDGGLRKIYLLLSRGLEAEIVKTTDPKHRLILFRLYNELVVSFLALSVYRLEDISSRTDNPITRMYGHIRSGIELSISPEEQVFMDQNIGAIAAKVPLRLKVLRLRFTQLIN